MKNRILLILWAGLFVLCAGLGFVKEPGAQWVLTAFSLAFFVPPMMLLRRGDAKMVKLVRCLSFASLVISLLMIILNVMAATASQTAGKVMYALLVVLSTPMVCSGFWALSLFGWACLWILAMQKNKKK